MGPYEKQSGKRISSPAAIAANRANSKKSTGPKSEQGKSVSKMNALKHGLCSKSNVITAGICAESQAEFDDFLFGLMEAWEPVGDEELSLVQEIAISRWRLARARGCEAAVISREAQHRVINAKITEVITRGNPMKDYCGIRPSGRALYSNPKRLEPFCAVVEVVLDNLERDGFLSPDFFGVLSEIVGERSAMACFPGYRLDGNNLVKEVGAKADLSGESQTRGTVTDSELGTGTIRRDLVISDLRASLEGMRQVAEMWRVYEKIEDAQPISITAVDDQTLARLDRYETAAVRNIYLAISTLEKVQARRKQESSSFVTQGRLIHDGARIGETAKRSQ